MAAQCGAGGKLKLDLLRTQDTYKVLVPFVDEMMIIII
jgi:hypothetical protein